VIFTGRDTIHIMPIPQIRKISMVRPSGREGQLLSAAAMASQKRTLLYHRTYIWFNQYGAIYPDLHMITCIIGLTTLALRHARTTTILFPVGAH
jgi:hypothetical protein